MDDHFLTNLKSSSVKYILEEHGPSGTTSQRLGTARPFDPTRTPTAASSSNQPQQSTGSGGDNEITTLATYRPVSAAFAFSQTGRANVRGGPPPSMGWESGTNSARPPSSIRGSRLQTSDVAMEFIPDLDEVREEDLTQTVASAPLYEISRLVSLKELDDELLQNKPFSVVDGVNLRKLCKFLVPEKELIEQDEAWTWDRLYTEMSELNNLDRYQKSPDVDNESLSTKAP